MIEEMLQFLFGHLLDLGLIKTKQTNECYTSERQRERLSAKTVRKSMKNERM